uniref:Nitrilase n=1 Tax=uncultured organism TaxID=155900 RepID=Q6RWN2_9ZZZZ|nr:nitrilase [uncultured organism]
MGITHPKFKAAAVQAAPGFLDSEATVDKTIRLMQEAADHGASLIVFPEAWLPGYPWWIWLGPPAWGMQFVQRYFDNSPSVGDDLFRRIERAAAKAKIEVVLGLSERAAGSLYLAQAFISSTGETRAVRRKLRPTHVERTVFGEGDGSDFKVFDTPLGRVGGLLCWEHLQPLSRYAMFSMNEQVHAAAWPTFSLYTDFAHALGHELNLAASATYAAEGQCYVIAACGVVTQEMLDLMKAPCPPEYLRVGGGYAMIFAPDGRRIAAALPPEQEGLIYADIDLSMISLAKAAADPTGHYSRPDVVRLMLNTEPMQRVEKLQPPLDSAARRENEPARETAAATESRQPQ